MTNKLKMRGRIPGDNLIGAIGFLNSLDWNLTWNEENGQWLLWGGDQQIFMGTTKHELEAFVLGMALGLAVLPEDFLDKIRELIAD